MGASADGQPHGPDADDPRCVAVHEGQWGVYHQRSFESCGQWCGGWCCVYGFEAWLGKFEYSGDEVRWI